MFGLFRKKAPAARPFLRELASPQPNGFTAEEIATINGSYLIVREAVYGLGGELPSSWDESFSGFEMRAPDRTLAQVWMIRAFYNGLKANRFVLPDGDSGLAQKIGRTFLNAYPAALDSVVGRLCLATREAFDSFANRRDDDDD